MKLRPRPFRLRVIASFCPIRLFMRAIRSFGLFSTLSVFSMTTSFLELPDTRTSISKNSSNSSFDLISVISSSFSRSISYIEDPSLRPSNRFGNVRFAQVKGTEERADTCKKCPPTKSSSKFVCLFSFVRDLIKVSCST